MKLLKLVSLSLLVTGFAMSANAATKAEEVIAAVKAACGKDVTADANRLVKTLFLCADGSTVDADGCQVKCLNKTKGAEVGK